MRRWLYALRLWCFYCIHKKNGPDKPLAYYAHRYDRRQENFRGEA